MAAFILNDPILNILLILELVKFLIIHEFRFFACTHTATT